MHSLGNESNGVMLTSANETVRNDKESLYEMNWSNSRWNPQCITRDNVLEYFSDLSNPFYDHHCNNEYLRMQRLGLEHLLNMIGLEYALHTAQEPILYTIVKQERNGAAQVIPQAMYYVINGVVHQAPDMPSLINSRLLSATFYLNTAFQELMHNMKYSIAANALSNIETTAQSSQRTTCNLPEVKKSSAFQRLRVEQLLKRWCDQNPTPQMVPVSALPGPTSTTVAAHVTPQSTNTANTEPPSSKRIKSNDT